METYVAIFADGECCGFTSKRNFDAWTQEMQAGFLEDTDGTIEFEGPSYPGETASLWEVETVFAEVKRLASEAVKAR